ncbi:MAG: MBL fold metallo-hydrolase, partial [Elusimicrobia bacterium]|nr:MBL fold metallo-hydrolase [Elusimicrobiota bacterium]
MPKLEREMQGRWRRLGKAGVRLDRKKIVYIDPVSIGPGAPKADIILLTHGHEGHFSPEDVVKAAGPQTIVAGPAACIGLFRLNQLPFEA